MTPQEFRQGNYIMYEQTTHIVCGILEDRIYSWWVKNGEPVIEYETKDAGGAKELNPYFDTVENYKGIPITEETLKQIGITRYGGQFDFYDELFKYHIKNIKNEWYFSFHNEENDKKWFFRTVEYIHQIQNIVFDHIGIMPKISNMNV